MDKVFFTPGPTQLYPEVKTFINQALDDNILSLNHRSKEFIEIFSSTCDSLRRLLNIPSDFHIFFLSSATECMDRIIQNVVDKNSFHFVNGAFAERFYKTAIELNKNAVKAEVNYGEGFKFDEIKINNDPELIAFTQNETSTGVALNADDIYRIKEQFPDSIVAVDIVTSAPFVNLDYTKIDSAFFSVQKGFGMPAGLGVLIVNDKCIEKAKSLNERNISIGSYHNFLALHENALKFQNTETPNVLGIYLLGKVCDALIGKGIENIRKETEAKSKLIYDFLDEHKKLKPFVKDKTIRSHTIINIEAGDKQAEIKKQLAGKGILVGSGYGKFKDTQIRIANFPMHTIDDVRRIIEVLSDYK